LCHLLTATRTVWVGWLVGDLTAQQLQVLRALRDGRVTRGRLHGDLEPHVLEGRSVSWTVSTLALRGYVAFERLGPAAVTVRGIEMLDGHN